MVGRIWQIILNTPCTPAGAADPIAFGQPAPVPRDVGMVGGMAGWLVGWLSGWMPGHMEPGSNRLRSTLERYEKQDAILNAFWMALGCPSWTVKSNKLEAKIV